jgi:hypothetical protein
MSDRDQADETPVPAAGDQTRKVAEQGPLSRPVRSRTRGMASHTSLSDLAALSARPNEAGPGAYAPPERPIGLMTRRLIGRVAR